ncbi:MAG: XdhC family protein [Rugosibacter sp.]|jgi:xanthine dehydrogenase accessory factor|nr:xanthine dehydrogenase accessory factor [Rugosibacter sp.]
MDSTDLQVLRIAIDWLLAGHRIMLVTVAATWGSAPRPPGAWAAVRDDGVLAGSVSGGCIEDDLVQRVREGLLTKNEHRVVDIVTYGVTREEAARFGLPCGGTLRLVIETAPDVQALQQLLARTGKGELTARTLDLATGQVTLADATAQDTLIWNGQRLVTLHGPQLRLLIIGAGQISHYLASMAQALDYAVIVCDPREEYRAAWQVANTQLVADMPDDAVLALIPDARTAIVAVTHDPKLDDLALLEALKSPAFYVGALGSRTNTAKRKERLGQHFDLSLEELNRLHGPVGLPIGSRTPAEIAVSILAEMTAVRHGMQSPTGEQKTTTTAANTCPIR